MASLGTVQEIMKILGPQDLISGEISDWSKSYRGYWSAPTHHKRLDLKTQTLLPYLNLRPSSPRLPINHRQYASEHETTCGSLSTRFYETCQVNWPIGNFTDPEIGLKRNMARPSACNSLLETAGAIHTTSILRLKSRARCQVRKGNGREEVGRRPGACDQRVECPAS